MNKRILFTILGIVLLVALGIIVKLFIIGTKDYQYIEITSVGKSKNNLIQIEGNITNESYKYKSFSYVQVAKELYVTINTVKTFNAKDNNSFSIEIPVSLSSVEHIQLTDDKTTKVIYK